MPFLSFYMLPFLQSLSTRNRLLLFDTLPPSSSCHISDLSPPFCPSLPRLLFHWPLFCRQWHLPPRPPAPDDITLNHFLFRQPFPFLLLSHCSFFTTTFLFVDNFLLILCSLIHCIFSLYIFFVNCCHSLFLPCTASSRCVFSNSLKYHFWKVLLNVLY